MTTETTEKQPELLNVYAAAKLLGVSYQRVYQLAAAGELAPIHTERVVSATRYARDDVLRLKRKRARK